MWWNRRRLGWLPDAPDPRDYDVDKLGMGRVPVASESSLRSAAPPVFNQGPTSSCVGQAFAGGMAIREHIALGDKAGTPSSLYIYWLARSLRGAQSKDAGTYLRDAARALRLYGVPDADLWPFATTRVNRQPGWSAMMHAHPRRGGDYYRIFDAGPKRLDAICTAVLTGYPVVFGADVDRAFTLDDGPLIVDSPTGQIIGGHAMVITGYRFAPEGLHFEVRNSWGPGWRDGGYAWLTADFIAGKQARDFWILNGWERIRE